MSGQGIAQILVYAVVLIALAYPLGLWMARVYTARRLPLAGLERGFYRLVRADANKEQDWKSYAKTVLVFSVVFSAVVYAIQRLQGHLFLNPDHLKGVPSHIALNTTASFVTNTNWQYYGGEYTMSYLTQMGGLAVQQFVSAAVGMAVLAAVVRGLSRRSAKELGNFWVDLYRSLVYILLPLSLVLAVILVSQGVPQTFAGHATATTLEGVAQTIARGPVALMIAIKQLGTNGGGFFNSNSAVPFENPNGLTNFLEVLSILLIPAAQVFMFGKMVLARRHAWMVFAAMFAMFAVGVAIALPSEQHGSQVLRASGVNITQGHGQSGGNMSRQGGPLRDRQHGALGDRDDRRLERLGQRRPRRVHGDGGAVPLVNIFVGEVIFGGVGSGLYGMFFYILIAVFVAGPDGRAHARVPRQEDRGARDQVRGARRALRADDGADADRGLGRDALRARLDLQPRRARLHRGALRLHLAVEQQRQRLRRLRRDQLLGVARRDRDAARTLRAAASPRSRSAARWPRRRPRPPRRAPSAPTGRPSSCCSSA